MPINSIADLKRLFKTSLADGKVTTDEAAKLVETVKKNGVTASERRQLREQFLATEDRFERSAANNVKDFIENQIPSLLVDDIVAASAAGRTDLPDPALPSGNSLAVRYMWTTGKLFKNGPSADDVIQGMLGDCYVMAAFGAVAAQDPERIKKMIIDNKDGTFTVHFHDLTKSPPATVPVTVDGELPTRNGGLEFARSRDRSELWVPILEKAYAQWKGSYGEVGKGGSLLDVMSSLTGRSGGVIPVAPGDEQSTFEVAEYALKAGLSVAACTKGHAHEADYKGTGIYAEHGYSILGVEQSGGKTLITLRNPWGEVEPQGNGKDDGVFTIEMTRFLELFQEVYIS